MFCVRDDTKAKIKRMQRVNKAYTAQLELNDNYYEL